MEPTIGLVLTQAKALRQLCSDNAHGAARDAFLARLEDDIEDLYSGALGVTVVPLAGVDSQTLSRLLSGLATVEPTSELVDSSGLLTIGNHRPSPAGAGARSATRVLPLASAAAKAGLRAVNLAVAVHEVFSSPLLFGRLVQETDLLVLVGSATKEDDVLLAGLARLAEQCRYAVHLPLTETPGSADTLVKGLFRDWQAAPAETAAKSLLTGVWPTVTPEKRREALGHGALSRLALHADLLGKQVQSELADLKFRQAEFTRFRRGEDIADGSADLREQADALKASIDQWLNGRKDALALIAADGILPFDPRLLANRLEVHELIHREEKSAAVTKYPILNARFFRPLVSHEFTLLPDPAALAQIQGRLVAALETQVRSDSDSLSQHSGELADSMRRNGELYPLFASALSSVRLPLLPKEKVARTLENVELEVEAEDRFVREGFFKRLMEGRMVASMAFSFVTMSAGIFVLFGDPSIKRGLMKFSGVIVIMMVLYFIFTLMIAGEEEKKELEEKLEKVRGQIHQAVMRPLAKAEQAIMKIYQEFIQEVKDTYLTVIDGVTKVKVAEKARIAETRKREDELQKAFLQRRQQSSVALTQKVPQFITGLDKTRAELDKQAAGTTAASATSTGLRPATPATPAAAAAAAAPSAASAAVAAAQERLAALRAAKPPTEPSAAAPPAAPGAKPMTVAERLAALKARSAPPATPVPTVTAEAAVAATTPAVTPASQPTSEVKS
jgi:hypothetical protein